MLDMLQQLTAIVAPSGSEKTIADAIHAEIQPYVNDLKTDSMGNLIAHIQGEGKKILFAAHMDEIGLIVTFIDDNGFLRVSNLGGVSPHTALFQRVIFQNGVTGVVGCDGKTEAKSLKLSDLYIDIGAGDKKTAEQMISIGDAAGFAGAFAHTGSCITSRCLDDRAGCAVLIEAIRQIAKQQKPPKNDLYFAFTVQEELGLRGAKTAAFGVLPDYGIAVDVTRTGDIPNCPEMAVALGKGPAIKVKDSYLIAHPAVKQAMMQAAEQAGIPYQLEVLERGGTDAGAIHLTASGIPSGCISIPCRYIHSPAEMISAEDLANCVKLTVAVSEIL